MPYVIFVRHGESAANTFQNGVGSEYKSDPNDSPLTKLGEQQAAETGKFLHKHFNVKKIYTSPYLRCTQTAKCIGNNKIPIIEDDLLHEFSHGVLNGMPIAEYNKQSFAAKVNRLFKQMVNPLIEPFLKKNNEAKLVSIYKDLNKLVGFETFEQAYARSKKIIKKYIRQHKEGDIVVCGHRGIIVLILALYCNIEGFAMPTNYGTYTNCSITVFNMSNKGRIDMFLYTKHLNELKKIGGKEEDSTDTEHEYGTLASAVIRH